MANSPIMINKKAIPEEGIRLDKNYSASTNALGQAGTTNAGGSVFGLAANSVLIHLGGTVIRGSGTPGDPSDLITKAYADTLSAGLSWKAPVKAATTAAGTLISDFENGDTLDGVTLATNDRILIKDQAAPAVNGIYIVQATGSPARAADFDAWGDVPSAAVFVEQGTANGDKGFVCTSDSGGTLGTTAITFVQFTSTTSVGFATAAAGGGVAGKVTVDTTRSTTGSGLGIDVGGGNDGEIYINLGATPGLEIASNALSVKLDATPALALGAGGLSVSLDTNPGLQKTSGLKILLDAASGLQLAAGGLSIDLDANPGLQLGAGGVSVLLAGTSGLTTTGGLAIVLGTDPGLEFVSNTLEAKVNASASMAKTASGLEVSLNNAGAIIHSTGLMVDVSLATPTLEITGTGNGKLGVKINTDESLVPLAAGIKASEPKKQEFTVSGYTSGTLTFDLTVGGAQPNNIIASGYQTTDRVRLEVIGGPVLEAANYTVPTSTSVAIPVASTHGIANGDKFAITYIVKAA
jgi:hypothetical protein